MKLLASLVLVSGTLAAESFAQPLLHVTARNRFIEATTSVTNPDGSTMTNGPIRMEGPPSPDPSIPPFYPINLDVPGPVMAHGMQEGGFNGNDAVELHAWDINLNGDAPMPGSASATINNTFGYTFTVSQPLDFTLQGILHTTPTMGMGYTRAHFALTGPGVAIDLRSPDNAENIIMLDGQRGRLNPGTYTFVIEVTAHVVDFSPGPVNAHADGPLAAIRVTPAPGPTCGTADFNGDGDTGTDQDIEAFFRCLAGDCCTSCFEGGADFNGDGDVGTDQDIEAFFRVLAGNPC